MLHCNQIIKNFGNNSNKSDKFDMNPLMMYFV